MKKSILTVVAIATILSSCKKDSKLESDSLYKTKLEKSANLKVVSASELPKNLGDKLLKFESYEEMYKSLNFSVSGEKLLPYSPSSVPNTASSIASLNNPAVTTVDYSGQISDVATASGGFGQYSVGAVYTINAKAGFYPVSGNGWSVQVISTSATSPNLTFSGPGQIEPGPGANWLSTGASGSFLTIMQG